MTKTEIEAKIKEVQQNISDTSNVLEMYKKQLVDYKKQLATIKKNESGDTIIKAIDEIFAMLNKNTNTVIIGSCGGDYADCFDGYTGDTFFGLNFPTPEIYIWDSYNTWCVTETDDSWDNKKYEKYQELLKSFVDIVNNIDDTIIPYPEDVFDRDCGINECWSGYIALTRDHKLVKFVCRDDSMMADEYEKHPCVIYDFDN